MKILLYAGSQTTDITALCSRPVWSGDKLRAVRELRFDALRAPETQIEIGDHVALLDEEGDKAFWGEVVTVNRALDAPAISVRCFDYGMFLANNQGTYNFRSITPEAACAKICTDYGIPLLRAAPTGVQLSRKFARCSLFDILTTLYTLAGERTGQRFMIRFAGTSLEVVERTVTPHALRIEAGGNLFEAAGTSDITGLCNSVAIYSRDGRRLQVIENTEARRFGLMQRHIVESKKQDAARQAKAILEDRGPVLRLTVEAAGDFAVRTGDTVELETAQRPAELYWVDADTHSWEDGLHTMRLELNHKNKPHTAEAGGEL